METQKHDRIVSLLKQEIKDLEAAAEEWKKMHDKRLDPQKVKEAIIWHRNQEGYLQAQDLIDYLGLE